MQFTEEEWEKSKYDEPIVFYFDLYAEDVKKEDTLLFYLNEEYKGIMRSAPYFVKLKWSGYGFTNEGHSWDGALVCKAVFSYHCAFLQFLDQVNLITEVSNLTVFPYSVNSRLKSQEPQERYRFAYDEQDSLSLESFVEGGPAYILPKGELANPEA